VGIDTATATPLLAASGFEARVVGGTIDEEVALLRAWYPDGIDLLIVDHYDYSCESERAYRPWARRILVLDDGTGRPHDCDVLVDAAALDISQYNNRVPPGARILVGPQFALLRRSFTSQRDVALKRRDGRPVSKVLLSFGATDARNALPIALGILDELIENATVTVAMSSRASNVNDVRQRIGKRVHLCVDADIAGTMVDADLAITSASVMAYECAVLGLPAILIILADNQRGLCQMMVGAGAALFGGDFDRGFVDQLRHAFGRVSADAALRVRLAKAASALIDGFGARRIAEEFA
jgi:spore coat polysaccharide biosynthesis predicted glycosyltransferase SpsG